MKCLTYGWMTLIFTLILFLLIAIAGEIGAKIAMVISLGMLIWFIAGFFVECDKELNPFKWFKKEKVQTF